MQHDSHRDLAWIWALPAYATLTLAATLTHQPDPETQFRAWSEYVTTPVFYVSHVFGSILATALLFLGVLALSRGLANTPRARAAQVGAVGTVLGGTGVVAVFGVAAFAQPALGHAFLKGTEAAEQIYADLYDAGTLVVAVSAVAIFSVSIAVLGWAAASSASVPRWAAIFLGASGPLIGIVGLSIGVAQTLGSLLLLAGSWVIALRIARSQPALRLGRGTRPRRSPT